MPTSKNTGNGASAPTLTAQQLEACQLMGLTRTQCLNQIPGYHGGRDTSCPSGWRKVSYKGKTACRHQKVGDTYCYLTPGHDPQCWTASGPIPSPACVGPGCPPTGPPAPTPPPSPGKACGTIWNVAHQNIVANIQQLQTYEHEMFLQLQDRWWNEEADIDGASSEDIITRINELAAIRARLFKELKNAYTSAQCTLNNDRQDLADQIAMISLVEKELDDAKANINELETTRGNKLRMVEINSYEYNRYKSHKDIFRVIAFCALGVLISIWMINRGLGALGKVGVVLSIAIGIWLTASKIFANWGRSSWNWKQFVWPGGTALKDKLKKGYESVWQYDVNAFWKGVHQAEALGKEAEHYFDRRYDQVSGDLNRDSAYRNAVRRGERGWRNFERHFESTGQKKHHHDPF